MRPCALLRAVLAWGIVTLQVVISLLPARADCTSRCPSCAAFMFLVPLVTGFCVSRLLAEPAFQAMQDLSPMAFAPSDNQKVGIHRLSLAAAI